MNSVSVNVFRSGPKVHSAPSKPSSPRFGSIKREGLAETVVNRIEAMIASGELQPGNRLPPERELAALLGISRPSLRTGLKALAIMGVITSKPGAGTFVAEAPSVRKGETNALTALADKYSTAELFEVRRALELGLAELAASRARRRDVAVIKDRLEAMRGAIDSPMEFFERDAEFHRAVSAAAQNPLMSDLLDAVLNQLEPARRETAAKASRSKIQTSFGQHALLTRAIEANNPRLARSAMAEHFDSTREIFSLADAA